MASPDVRRRGREPLSDREQRILGIIETARAKRAKFRDERITMAHGAGGKATQTLIEGLLVPALGTGALEELGDAGTVTVNGTGLALTTDSFVVRPIRFPGGSIGDLAVNGTVNDLAVAGARPLALTLSLILEEGLESSVLREEVEAIARAAEAAGVEVVAGDTKVVERGHADDMYICTAGLGLLDRRATLSPAGLAPGDRILLSGPVGDHGTAIMLARGEFELDAPIASDTRSLWPVVDTLLESAGSAVHCLRDATRGGVASVLNELARASGVAMLVREGRCRSTRRWRAPPRSSASTPCTSRTRASSSRSSRPSTPTPRSPRCAPSRAASRRRRSARCGPSRRAWCSSRPRSAAGG